MSKVKLNDLKKATKELNDLLFEEGNLIDVKLPQDELEPLVIEAAKLLEEGEEKELEKVTQAVLKALKATDVHAKETKEDAKEESLTLEEMVEECEDLDVMKKMIKEEDSFKGIRKGLGLQKDVEKLRTRMLQAIKDEQTGANLKPEKADKKDDKPAKKEKVPSAYGTSIDIMCANPTIEFAALEKLIAKEGIDIVAKKSAIRTAYGVVRTIVAKLQSNKLMK